MPNRFTDGINDLVHDEIDDHYEGSGVNDKTLGKMYYLKRYENAAKEEYDRLRKEVEVPTDLTEKTVISNDKRFSVVAQPRQGSSKLDKTLLHAELVSLLRIIQVWENPGEKPSQVRAALAADQIIAVCSTQSKDTVAVTIIEDKRDDA